METRGDRRWGEITDELGEIAGQINSLFGRVTQLAAEVDDENLLAGTSMHTVSHFLAWQLGLSKGRAQQLAKIGKRRSELPEVTALLDQGLLSADQAAPIAARLPGLPAADHHFAQLALNLSVDQIRKAVRATVPVDEKPKDDDESPPDPDDDRIGPRSISFGHRDDGTWNLTLNSGTADGATIETSLRAMLTCDASITAVLERNGTRPPPRRTRRTVGYHRQRRPTRRTAAAGRVAR